MARFDPRAVWRYCDTEAFYRCGNSIFDYLHLHIHLPEEVVDFLLTGQTMTTPMYLHR